MNRYEFDSLINFPNNYFVSRKYGYVFVSVPKCATSTMKKFLFEHVEKVSTEGVDIHGYGNYPKKPFLAPSDIFTNILMFKLFFVFSVVRNPYDRIISAYLDKIVRNKPEKLQITETLGVHFSFDVSFDDFLSALTRISPCAMDPHFSPQFNVLNLDKIKYDQLLRFESLSSDLVSLCSNLSVSNDFDIQKLNVVHHSTNVEAFKENFINNEHIFTINKIYSTDFSNLKYTSLV